MKASRTYEHAEPHDHCLAFLVWLVAAAALLLVAVIVM
jgi:hypothetical protein